MFSSTYSYKFNYFFLVTVVCSVLCNREGLLFFDPKFNAINNTSIQWVCNFIPFFSLLFIINTFYCSSRQICKQNSDIIWSTTPYLYILNLPKMKSHKIFAMKLAKTFPSLVFNAYFDLISIGQTDPSFILWGQIVDMHVIAEIHLVPYVYDCQSFYDRIEGVTIFYIFVGQIYVALPRGGVRQLLVDFRGNKYFFFVETIIIILCIQAE